MHVLLNDGTNHELKIYDHEFSEEVSDPALDQVLDDI